MNNPAQRPKPSGQGPTAAARLRDRFEGFLSEMADRGISQQQLARQTGIAAQQICDLKKGRRRMTELIARRLGEQFNIPYGWFLGHDMPEAELPERVPAAGQSLEAETGAAEGGQVVRLPMHTEPVDADPYDPARWSGSFIPVVGTAAVAAGRGLRPYVLRLAADGYRGQLKKGDLLLVFQQPDRTQVGDLGVIRSADRVLLAWRHDERAWAEMATGQPVDCQANVGHCVAVVWAWLGGRGSPRSAPPPPPQSATPSGFPPPGTKPIRRLNKVRKPDKRPV